MAKHMLTTTDNPYDPTDSFAEWYAWDMRNGYHTLSFLARVVRTSHDISEADQTAAIEHAIEEIVKENPGGFYRKIEIKEDELIKNNNLL